MTKSLPGADMPAARDPVEELAESFLERYRRGERPALTEYTDRAPEHADEIRELFPALVLMEQAAPASTGTAPQSLPAFPLERLGDYRVIREIGRGGMGIVYEAEQMALGRHVALKVLPAAATGDARCLLRFRREACSAARLHHTNIVSVFDIGERDGVHYYAMQFIHGQSLDAIITDLARLRGQEDRQEAARSPAWAVPQSPASAAGLASSLLSGRFREPPGDIACDSKASDADIASPLAEASDGKSGGSLSAVLSGDPDLSARSHLHFYRSVARVGLQIADALAYAHAQRVLHRDIKPSNLLLDAEGTIWVTDFGLAKEEGGDLTRTGEVVGTLRYMAPERFSGHSDVRSDIYSLGLTLYELLTLRPAFEEHDRARLIRVISHQEPLPPRKIDTRVPRDLETIVLKAIAKEPGSRYARAEELREDLRRFLADRPIHARRALPWERMRRWCRRNPGWAATIGTVLGLLVTMAVGGSLLSLHLERALAALQSADQAKTEKLWEAYVERARALRTSGRIGQRLRALEAISEAKKIKLTPELRDEAVAALVLPDAEIFREWNGCPERTVAWSHDAALRRYARLDKEGALTVCQLTDQGEDVIFRIPALKNYPTGAIHMSPDGRFLAHVYAPALNGIGLGMRLWNLTGPMPTVQLEEPSGVQELTVAFHTDGRRLALGHTNGTVSVYDLASVAVKRLNLGQVPRSLAFHPSDGRLAAACGDCVRLLDVDSGTERRPLRLPGIDSWSHGMAWHPAGKLLATTSEDQKIHIWDTETASESMPALEGHKSSGIYMGFNKTGDRLLSFGWDGQTRLWDILTGQTILTLPGRCSQFSADGSLVGMDQAGTRLRIWRLADGRELRCIRAPGIHSPLLGAGSRVMAAASSHGLGFFDVNDGGALAFVRFKNDNVAAPVSFDDTDGWMTAGRTGVMLWPQGMSARGDRIQIGPPRWLAASIDSGADASFDGRIRAVPQGYQTLVLNRDQPGRRIELGPQYDVRHCAVSPDGRWVATCSWWQDGRSECVQVWEAATGRRIAGLALDGPSKAKFSSDGRWLVTETHGHGGQLWEVGTWQPGLRFEGCFGWSSDGQLLALNDSAGVIRLVKPDGQEDVAVLTGPEAKWYTAICLTKDNTKLIASLADQSALHMWDLRRIRQELHDLGMDWDLPPFAAVANSDLAAKPFVIKVDSGMLRQPPFKDDHHTLAMCTLQLALQPFNREAYFERGLAFDRLGDPGRAVADYEMFLALTPRDDRRRPEAQWRRARNCYRHLKDDRKAASALAEAADASLELIPWPGQFALLCNDLAWHFAKSAPGTEMPHTIVRLAHKAVELEPYNFIYQNTLGVVLYRQGRYEEAIRWLEASLRHSRQFASFDCYFLAMSHQRINQRAKAREYLDRANASAEDATSLTPLQRQELAAFRDEAEIVLGISNRQLQE
jgi:serine/threonine protein kinase/WD40 repeat protein